MILAPHWPDLLGPADRARLDDLAGEVRLEHRPGIEPDMTALVLVAVTRSPRHGVGAAEIVPTSILAADPRNVGVVIADLVRRLTPWLERDPSPFPYVVLFPRLRRLLGWIDARLER